MVRLNLHVWCIDLSIRPRRSASRSEGGFADFCGEFFKRYFELHPTEAINYGVEVEALSGFYYLPFESTTLTWNRKSEIIHLKQAPRDQSEEPKANRSPEWLIFYQ
ncbi:MAG: hypothetical protein HYU47_11460 [Deltaproteobacteria bacterium]|nr:hypothetical protein [Deltaproteobacteria bacterium]